MLGNYVLNGKEPVPCDDILKWGEWFESNNRQVAVDEIGETRISTVFLGIDHSFGDGDPVLFETMVFGGELDQDMDRCSTWEEAEIMHQKMVDKVKALG